ncbi:SusD/RagB family nutrient-binding outer membrane lipoprotein [uncultured Arcticibacterium sp.]|uniref:SusD/RagB family nutrient-binding outer membrane lipoprotein n=1 Tax=uncultured Arcticibacterium sp. TaxID=2173042 RepID=UPI0030FC0FCB
MKNILITIFALAITSVSCTDGFEELNQNPNSPQNVGSQFLLTNVLSISSDANAYEQGFRLSNYLTHFAASVEFERIDRYEMGSNSGYWNSTYKLLSDIRSMQELAGDNQAYMAVGNIMKSYLFSQLTDMWGDVPYTDAVAALDGNYTPVYDSQEDIYMNPQTGILAVLKASAATLESTGDKIQGDIMFNGDLQKWVRFANSLRFRYLLRASNRLSDYSEMQALANSGKLMQSNADNAVVAYLSSAPNQFPMASASLGLYQEHRMTQTVDSVLTLWNDPRVAALYKPSQVSVNSGNPAYKGLQNGQSRETIGTKGIDLNDVSLFGAIFRDVPNGVDAQYMQYAELQFALAEAAHKGYISGDAETYYQNGITASFDYYAVELPADYLTADVIALDGSEDLTKILTQKWLSLINVGHEAWFNIRRTGIPALTAGPDNLNDGKYPVRYLYPESEQATNAANYRAAADGMGGDNINSKGWWEKP